MRRLLAIIIALSLLAGCGLYHGLTGDDEDDDSAPGNHTDTQITCGESSKHECDDGCIDVLNNDDHCGGCNLACPNGFNCFEGFCATPAPCQSDSGCDDDEICDFGLCWDQECTDTDDSECFASESCYDGRCSECRQDSDCTDGFCAFESRMCKPHPVECQSHQDCGSDELCILTECIKRCTENSCSDDETCDTSTEICIEDL